MGPKVKKKTIMNYWLSKNGDEHMNPFHPFLFSSHFCVLALLLLGRYLAHLQQVTRVAATGSAGTDRDLYVLQFSGPGQTVYAAWSVNATSSCDIRQPQHGRVDCGYYGIGRCES